MVYLARTPELFRHTMSQSIIRSWLMFLSEFARRSPAKQPAPAVEVDSIGHNFFDPTDISRTCSVKQDNSTRDRARRHQAEAFVDF